MAVGDFGTEAGREPARGWVRWAGLALLLLAAAVAAAPIWFHGPVGADDFEFHLISWLDAQHSWLHGIAYPHWATSPNFGAGEPRFVFYPPLTWMLGAAMGLVLPWAVVPFAMSFLLLAGTGIGVRALARQALPEGAAVVAGCAGIFSAYTLFTAYDRTAFGEMAGGFWIPVLLLFALRDRTPGAAVWRRALDGSALPLALAVAGCWLCDAPLGVMGSYLLAAVALIAAVLARSWFPVVRAAVATALGIAFTAVYLIPAAWEQRWVEISQATGEMGDQGLRIENNWIFPHHTDPKLHARDLALHFVTPVALWMIGAAVACLGAMWARGRLSLGAGGGARAAVVSHPCDRTESQGWGTGPLRWIGLARGGAWDAGLARGWWVPLAMVPALVLFLLLPVSLPVWNLLPKLRFLQFPWRWLLVVEAPLAVFFAGAVWPLKSQRRWLRAAVACVCAAVFLATTVYAARNFFRDDREDGDLAAILDTYRSGAGFVGTDEYAPAGGENTLVAVGLPDGCLTDDFDDEQGVQPTPEENPIWRPEQGSCFSTAKAKERTPEHLRIETNARRAGFLVLRLRSYPAWRVTVNGQRVTDLKARQDGLLSVPVPQGAVTVTVDWGATPDAIAGRWVSGLALLGLIGLWLAERKYSRVR